MTAPAGNHPRTLIIALGSAGDVHPMIPLALGLRDRGHHVAFMTNPVFRPLCDRLNLPLVPIMTEEDYKRDIQHPDLWHPTRATAYIAKAMWVPCLRPVYDHIAATQPDLVVGTPLSLGARVAHDKLHTPYVTVNLAPSIFYSVDQPPTYPGFKPWYPAFLTRFLYWLADTRIIDPQIVPAINALRAELGLGPIRRLIGSNYWQSPQLALGLFPQWFANPGGPPPADWPPQVRLTDFVLYDESDATPLPQGVQQFLADGPPPIVFTPGSAMAQGADFFRTSLEALQAINARGMFLTRHAEQIPANLPPSVRHFDFVPLSKVLPHAGAFVCHGGIGSVAQGLAAGCPQLVMAMAHDQPDNAARVERLGAGLALPRAKYRTPAVANALRALTTEPSYRQRAADWGKRIDPQRARREACDLIQGMLGPRAATSATS